MNQRGFTIFEIVMTIFLLAVAIPPLLRVFAETAVTGAESAILPTATLLANQMMEEIKSKRFDELTEKDSGGNWSTAFGADTGEILKDNFDDVDDFNGWTQDFAPSYPDYTATVSIDYVASTDLDSPLALPVPPVPDDWTPSYKLIEVRLSNAGLAADIFLRTVVSEVQSL